MSTITQKKCSAQQQIDHSENIASPAGVSRRARISSLPEEMLACERVFLKRRPSGLKERPPGLKRRPMWILNSCVICYGDLGMLWNFLCAI